MKPYIIKARYYETDQMGIIHHANYIRWMEEARIDLMDQMGYPYRRFEEMGYLSPVLRCSTLNANIRKASDSMMK